jgi:hypothetical protein
LAVDQWLENPRALSLPSIAPLFCTLGLWPWCFSSIALIIYGLDSRTGGTRRELLSQRVSGTRQRWLKSHENHPQPPSSLPLGSVVAATVFSKS